VLLLVVEANRNVSSVHVGSTIVFSCQVDDSDKFLWQFKHTSGDSDLETICEMNQVLLQFAKRHSVNFTLGNSRLTINDVQHCDAGIYRCVFLNNGTLSKCEFSLVTIGKYRAFSLTVGLQCGFVSAVAAVSMTRYHDFHYAQLWRILKNEPLNILQ